MIHGLISGDIKVIKLITVFKKHELYWWLMEKRRAKKRIESKYEDLNFDPVKVLEIKENCNCKNCFMTKKSNDSI